MTKTEMKGGGIVAAMLTTKDNPYDPRQDFAAWYAWDIGHGYHTSSYLARIMVVAEDVPESMRQRQIEEAIDEIIRVNDGEIYQKLEVEPVDVAS